MEKLKLFFYGNILNYFDVLTECNCHNHADDCVYNATVAARRLSLNIRGDYDGGGVCLNCKVSIKGQVYIVRGLINRFYHRKVVIQINLYQIDV